VLRLAEAADGFLARVRLPGGLVSAAQLRALAALADELGDGRVELTSRANVQLRGLAAGAAEPLTDGLTRAGLLPSLSHDRVRNVLASPLAGLDNAPGTSGAELTGIVRALDAALCARPRLAELPGRFLFAVDDGRGDVAGLGADVVATVRPDGADVNGLAVRPGTADAAGADAGAHGTSGQGARDVPDSLRDAIVAAMLAYADAFLDLRAELGSTAWRIADLPGGGDQIRAVVSAHLGLPASPAEQPDAAAAGQSAGRGCASGVGAVPARRAPATRGVEPGAATPSRPVGLVTRRQTGGGAESPAFVRDDRDCSAVLLAPLGRLTASQVTWVADRAAGEPARVTPWRSVVLPHVTDPGRLLRDAAGVGFGTDQASPWLRVTACAGRPGCASALADVQADAVAFAARSPGRLVHVSGCSRHCGRPAATEIDVTATSEGYQVAGI
jgi:precorrin-3B synthase